MTKVDSIGPPNWKNMQIYLFHLVEKNKQKKSYSQSTFRWILLLIIGGTPLVAIHIYAPMSNLETLCKLSMGPSTCETEIKKNNWLQFLTVNISQT